MRRAAILRRAALVARIIGSCRPRAGPAHATMIDQGVPAPARLSLAAAVARGRPDTTVRQSRRKRPSPNGNRPVAMTRSASRRVPRGTNSAAMPKRRRRCAPPSLRAAVVETPRNGWALFGLARSEEAQGHALDAAAARQALRRAWLGDLAWLRMDRL